MCRERRWDRLADEDALELRDEGFFGHETVSVRDRAVARKLPQAKVLRRTAPVRPGALGWFTRT